MDLLEHRPDGDGQHRAVGEAPGGELQRPKQRAVGIAGVIDEQQVGVDPAIQVAPDRNLADEPPLLADAQRPVVAMVANIAEP